MPATNTDTSYGSVTRTFHWLIALAILTLLPLGIVTNDLPEATGDEQALKAGLFQLHKTLGVLVFFVASARILWALTQTRPVPLHPSRRAEGFLAAIIHWLIYISLVFVPLTGWIGHAATTGFAPIWWPFGQGLPFVPKSEGLADVLSGLHSLFGYLLGVCVLLHIAGALKHQFVDRDATLLRMWSGRPAGRGRHERSIAPPLTATAIYVAALGIGATVGLFAPVEEGTAAPTLADVASEWQVTDGTLGLTVTQFGSDVSGRFDDWTAAITFDPDIRDAVAGAVDAAISIPSLTLGSVTEQALGEDYLSAAAFATATYDGQILHANDGYSSYGFLTVRDREAALDFPLDLAVNGDTATLTATVPLDRRDFGVGPADQDGTVAFPVTIDIALTATRGD